MTVFCKDCRYYEMNEDYQDASLDICTHVNSYRDVLGLVRGKSTEGSPYYCVAMRSGICGREGKLFEPILKEVA